MEKRYFEELLVPNVKCFAKYLEFDVLELDISKFDV